MLAILAVNLKLILLFFMIATITTLSRIGDKRWITASRSIRQRRIAMRERKALLARQAFAKKKALNPVPLQTSTTSRPS